MADMKPIPGYEGRYSITEDGRVFSHAGPRKKAKFLAATKDPDGYFFVLLYDGNGKRSRISPRIHKLMALAYLGVPKGQYVDHRDQNRENNHISNIRIATSSQNRANAKKSANNTSGFKGVNWRGNRRHWRVVVQLDKKKIYIGSFHDKVEAAKAYDEAAKKHFGEFACLNFPQCRVA